MARGVPGEGPDCRFPKEIIGFGPIPARILKFLIFILALSTARSCGHCSHHLVLRRSRVGFQGGRSARTQVATRPHVSCEPRSLSCGAPQRERLAREEISVAVLWEGILNLLRVGNRPFWGSGRPRGSIISFVCQISRCLANFRPKLGPGTCPTAPA